MQWIAVSASVPITDEQKTNKTRQQMHCEPLPATALYGGRTGNGTSTEQRVPTQVVMLLGLVGGGHGSNSDQACSLEMSHI